MLRLIILLVPSVLDWSAREGRGRARVRGVASVSGTPTLTLYQRYEPPQKLFWYHRIQRERVRRSKESSDASELRVFEV